MFKVDFTKRIISSSSENLSFEAILKHVEREQNLYLEIKDGISMEIKNFNLFFPIAFDIR